MDFSELTPERKAHEVAFLVALGITRARGGFNKSMTSPNIKSVLARRGVKIGDGSILTSLRRVHSEMHSLELRIIAAEQQQQTKRLEASTSAA